MNGYILSAPAERDLDQIVIYLADGSSVGIARQVLREIHSALEFLARNPGAGHARSDLTDDPYLFWFVVSYLIVYDPSRRPIEIVRIIHGARNVEERIMKPSTLTEP